MVMMLRQCCCGCSLKTGTIITGVLNILGALWNLYDGIKAATSSNYVDEDSKQKFVAIGSVEAVIGAILLLVAISLIVGAKKGKPALLVPWMVYNIVFLVANTILHIVIAVHFFTMGDPAFGAGYITAAVILILLGIYFLLVVYSLYRELKGTAPPNSA